MTEPILYFTETGDRTSFVNVIMEKFRADFTRTEKRKVFVKPNIVSREPYPTTTHPQVLASVLDFLLDWQCQVAVADGPAIDASNSDRIIANHPLAEVCKQRGIKLQNLHKGGFRKIRPHRMSLRISTMPYEYDYIISLPVLKPHPHCLMTGALKNQFGLLHNLDRLMMHTRIKSLSKGIVEANCMMKPTLFIIDAVETYRHANEKRHGGSIVKLGYMLAGKDPVALDSFGLDLLKRIETRLQSVSPEDIDYIAHASRLGLGCIDYKTEHLNIKQNCG